MSTEASFSNVEQGNDLGDPIREFLKRGCYLFVSEPKGGLAEDYKNGKKGIALRHVEIFAGTQTAQDGFIIQALKSLRAADAPTTPVPQHQNAANVGIHGDESFMLTRDVEVVNGSEDRVPSFVRPERFDRGSFAVGKPLFAFQAMPRVEHRLFGSKKREMCFGNRFFAVANGKSYGEQIEATTDGVDDRTHPRTKLTRKWGYLIRDPEIVASLRVLLLDNAIWVSALPFEKCALKAWDLGYGPIDGSLSI